MTEVWETYFDPVAAGMPGEPGTAGSDGTYADLGAWVSGTTYAVNQRVTHAKTGYGTTTFRCKVGHTATAGAFEPTIAIGWGTYWEEFAGGGADGTGSGDVTGPASSVSGNVAVFGDVSGKHIHDGGTPKLLVDTVLSAETASTTATDGDVDSVVVKESGGWKLKTLDNVFTRWIPIEIPAGAFISDGTTPCGAPTPIELGTNKHNYKSCAFGYSAKSYGWAPVPSLPFGYTGGTIKAYIVWYSEGTTSNGVRFGIQGNAIGDNESLDPVWGTAVEVTDNATGTAYRRLKTSVLDAITLGGSPAGGETLSIRLYRDPDHGDDNLNEIVYVLGVTLLIPINKQSEV
jgi:hypothetical protein